MRARPSVSSARPSGWSPRTKTVRTRLGELLLQAGKREQAREMLEQQLREDPADAEAARLLGPPSAH